MKFENVLICVTLGMLSFGNMFASSDMPSEESSAFGGYSDIAPLKEMQFHSQAAQDQFVYALLYRILDKQDHGTYLEIGAGYPIYINNTFFFEDNLKWKGVSIDLSTDYAEKWRSVRENPLLIEDATKSDYRAILQSFPKIIDYLSLDVDDAYTQVLERIPFGDYIFKIITIEHDFYRYGDIYRKKEREILHALGYHLLCPDVSNEGNIYEDWWIHPSVFPPSVFSKLTSLDLSAKEHKQIIETIQAQMLQNH